MKILAVVAAVLVGSLVLPGSRAADSLDSLAGAIQIQFEMPARGPGHGGHLHERRTVGSHSRSTSRIEERPAHDPLGWIGFMGQSCAVGDYEVKVFTGPGLRANWEFAIASPNRIPWPTKPVATGDTMRCGGWLGDHGVSSSAVAVGDRIYLGTFMAEHGHALIYCNLDGEKMWGRGGLDGWNGPQALFSDGQSIYGIVADHRIYRMDLDCENVKLLCDTKEDEITAAAAWGGKLVLAVKNHELTAPLVKAAVGGRSFNFNECVPQPDGSRA